MNAGFLRVAKLNGHHNRVQAGRGRGWGLAGREEAGRREAWEAITQKNYSHSAWKASLRCLDRLMVWRGDDEKDEEDAWLRWRRRMRAGELGGGGGGVGAERLVVQGNQSNHSLTPAPRNPTSSGVRWKVTFFSSAHHFQGKCEEFEKTKQSWQSWLFGVAPAIWELAVAGGRGEEPVSKTFPKAFKNICPAAKNFSLSISRLPLDKVGYRVIVRLFSGSQFPPHSLLHDSQNIFGQNLIEYFL